MMKKYRSKIGLEFLLFLIAVIVLPISAADDGAALYLFMIAFVAFILYVIFSFRYSVKEETLTVHNAFFLKTKIDIQTIRKITETNNLMSSPSASLDRIEIMYGNKFDSVLISPVRTDDFISTLLKINPGIMVKMKPTKSFFSKLAL